MSASCRACLAHIDLRLERLLVLGGERVAVGADQPEHAALLVVEREEVFVDVPDHVAVDVDLDEARLPRRVEDNVGL